MGERESAAAVHPAEHETGGDERRDVRACGACRACCEVFDIEALGKPRNVLCAHADATGSDRGCTIYQQRPGTCRDFECAWKQGLADEGDRPDLIGVMFYLIPLTDGGPGLGVIELEAGALGRARAGRLVSAFAARKPGRVLVRAAKETAFRPAMVLIEGRPLRPVTGVA